MSELADWHHRLGAAYSALQQTRSTPLFALEHGLSSEERDELSHLVRRAVAHDIFRADSYLPYVVYSTELGYRYEGDEYWPTFAKLTPGWNDSRRDFVRASLSNFARAYDGIRPSGAWARQFRIIAWPITHAVLPTDLQRHLARLLYEYRYSFDADLLNDPHRLGTHLESYAWNASKRFQQFAENTQLLGQVAAALLTSDDESDGRYLEPMTLRRVVEDLNTERQSRFWLRTAKNQVSETRLRASSAASTPAERRERPPSLDPKVSLIADSNRQWRLTLEFPDMSSLAARYSDVGSELRGYRVEVGGSDGRMLPRQQLLYPRQRVTLDQWPKENEPLLRVEGGSPLVNGLLADHSSFLPGPPWLFRVATPGVAVGVRGRQVHVGGHYVVAAPPEMHPDVSWIVPADTTVSGVSLWEVRVPSPLTAIDAGHLESLGFGVISHLDIRPLGAVPAAWDRASTIEWVSGSPVLIGVACDRRPDACVVAIEGEPERIRWPSDEETMFLRFTDLEPGEHEVQIGVYAEAVEEPLEVVDLSLQVRRPTHTRMGGDPREGLAVFADPARPTLSEIWDRQAALEIVGPEGFNVDVGVRLTQGRKTLWTTTIRFPLPVTPGQWHSALSKNVREVSEAAGRYDEADAVEISVQSDRLGQVDLRCEREFRPLRWILRKAAGVASAKLVDSTNQTATAVRVSPFDHPFRHTPVPLQPSGDVTLEEGGLLTATGVGVSASVVLAPAVRGLEDLGRLVVSPSFPRLDRSLDSVHFVLANARSWSSAESSGTFASETARVRVVNAIAANVACILGGEGWRHLEHMLERGDRVSMKSMVDAIGDSTRDRRLAVQVRAATTAIVDARSVFALVQRFNRALSLGGYETPKGFRSADCAEVLLRLVSDPASLVDLAREQIDAVARSAFAWPAVGRAARYAILAIALDADDLELDLRRIWQ